jgi:hypothetical protein
MARRSRGSSKPKLGKGPNAKPTNRNGAPKQSPRVDGMNKRELRQARAAERAGKAGT